MDSKQVVVREPWAIAMTLAGLMIAVLGALGMAIADGPWVLIAFTVLSAGCVCVAIVGIVLWVQARRAS